MKQYTDHEIIEGIATNKSKVLMYVYREFFPYIENYVLQHGGTTDQTKDIFQEGMIVIYRKVRDNNLELYSKFSTYLYAVCKRIWIQEKKKENLRTNKTNDAYAADPPVAYGVQTLDEAKELFDLHFQKIRNEYQQILRLFFNGCNNNEIQESLGLKTVHQVVDRKYRAKKELINSIKNDPSFRKFIK